MGNQIVKGISARPKRIAIYVIFDKDGILDGYRTYFLQELKKVTEAFYMVDKSRSRAEGGAGLGLALCKEIAALHQGSLHFESQLDLGTKVTVELGGIALA